MSTRAFLSIPCLPYNNSYKVYRNRRPGVVLAVTAPVLKACLTGSSTSIKPLRWRNFAPRLESRQRDCSHLRSTRTCVRRGLSSSIRRRLSRCEPLISPSLSVDISLRSSRSSLRRTAKTTATGLLWTILITRSLSWTTNFPPKTNSSHAWSNSTTNWDKKWFRVRSKEPTSRCSRIHLMSVSSS